MRKCTSRAPALRTMRTILRLVVPRTIESSHKRRSYPRADGGLDLVQLHAEIANRLEAQ